MVALNAKYDEPPHRYPAFFMSLAFGIHLQATAADVCDDSSLRSAIATGGSISLNCSAPIVLYSPIIISNDVELAAKNNVTITGSNAVQLFIIEHGKTFIARNITFADGCARGTNGNAEAPGGPGFGGAIYNNGGNFEAHGCAFLRNKAFGGTGGAGSEPGGAGEGGAVYNAAGEMYFSRTIFSDNLAKGGQGGAPTNPPPNEPGTSGPAAAGAICNSNGDDCEFLRNAVAPGERGTGRIRVSPATHGGAVFQDGGEMEFARNRFSLNSSAGGWGGANGGGALFLSNGQLSLTECWFDNNTAVGGVSFQFSSVFFPGGEGTGGALQLERGSVVITNSAFSNNRAIGGMNANGPTSAGAGMGGAVWNAGTVEFANVTMHGNLAQGGYVARFGYPGGSAYGGALYNAGGAVTLNHVTVARNTALMSPQGENWRSFQQGSGIFSPNGTVFLESSLLAYSIGTSNCFGTLSEGGYNLSSDSSCGFSSSGSVNAIDPRLSPLMNWGGLFSDYGTAAG